MIYCEVVGSTNKYNEDIGSWMPGKLVDVGYCCTKGYGDRFYVTIENNSRYYLEFDRGVDTRVKLLLGDGLSSTGYNVTNGAEFILTEENVPELKAKILTPKETENA